MTHQRIKNPDGEPLRRSVTISDVAREAGVGLGTASRALSGHAHVAEATRQRVLDAAARLGYRPNPIARAFSRRRTHTLEVLVPIFTRSLFVEVLRGVEEVLADSDYALVLRSVERREDRERVFQSCCAPGRADGVLVVSMTPADDFVDRLEKAGLPIVLIDATHPRLPAVVVDHEAGMVAAVNHCLELGHTRIALIDRDQDPFGPNTLSQRRRGYRKALTRANQPIRPEYEQVVDFSPAAAAIAVDGLLQLPLPPTAILHGSDTQAMGALDAARRRAVRVPMDLSVVGYNDVELAQYLGLTTVRVPMRELGRRGASLLLTALDGSIRERRIELPTELVVRDSCGPPPRPA